MKIAVVPHVSRFDMLPGIDVKWWSAVNDDVYSFLSGKTISDAKLAGLYSNATMEVTLLKGLAWEDIKVLSVWDSATASNFGHIILQLNQSAPPPTSGGPVVEAPNFPPTLGPSPLLAPPPLDDGSSSPPTSSMMGNWEPTMFENCVALSPSFRVRWTLGVVPGTVDIGLESALTKTQYMAFGWAKPGITEQYMIGADVVVAGIDDKGFPLSEDYFMSSYSECNWDKSKPAGVCPDSFFAGTTSGLNNSEMLHGQQIDGITLVRYRRPLASLDINYDVSLNASQEMVAVWAMGSLAPDSMRVHFTPQNHGLPQGVKYGYLNLTLGSSLDQCFGPLPASNASQGNIVVADRGTSLVVTSDVAYEYPNPPNPRKVLYINSKEAPILRVERGVPVTFLVQAGHDVSFYVTSNPIGGSGRSSSKIYAGGPDAHGVPTIPYTLKWLPDRRTPDKVYYQSYFQKKMGWMVQVVDGGLSDMYNTSHLLADGQVTLFWTLTSTDVYFAVRGERKSGYLAVAFGSGMLNSFAYVAWIDDKGNGHIGTYWITDKDASGIHPTAEELFNKKCERVDGVITFEFSRPLKPDCQSGQECKNVIDATSALKMVWAMGDEWSVNLTNGNIHTIVSTTPTLIYLAAGAAKVEELQPVLEVHGFMMFFAWGLFFPGGAMAARYFKHINQDGWLRIHVYAQTSGVFVTFLGLLFAVAEVKRLEFDNVHTKLGFVCLLSVCLQAATGFLRPPKDRGLLRTVWEYFHLFTGRTLLLLGFVTLFTGVTQLGSRDEFEHVRTLEWSIVAWVLALAFTCGYIEMHDFWIRGQKSYTSSGSFRQGYTLGDDEDDSTELITPIQKESDQGPQNQLEMRGTMVPP
ncbi:cytochrome b561, DM13 and DOMON domain-containing protein At5g54830 isoform X2 [Physcomitrium patens]|uniref:Cytochrome b561 domain-containing protein n=1 Tax=Physcomitrium patens TaxID=3218 RepID=A0A7I4F1N9_PHYPA|nr:cytochrome b561, DM13 and DOMON domain-containing protein At5g54830-like isoform X2 [Physcomitrium patens]|eukprot:XP_024390031.1 cytochrome b561, DM13 and DOMON domain-containing protein At5g54830-like isoform X2 [Physcomitrella patens]